MTTISICTHCNQKMKIDESQIPENIQAKVRCPHCGHVEDYPIPTDSDPSTLRNGKTPKLENEQTSKSVANHIEDVRLPADAFQNFRFPSELDPSDKPVSRPESQSSIYYWLIASVIIVLFFALLVNLILPGPGANLLQQP